MGREVGGGSCLGMHVRIKDFKIKKKKNKEGTPLAQICMFKNVYKHKLSLKKQTGIL